MIQSLAADGLQIQDRVLGRLASATAVGDQPTIVFFAGLHGNEPSGVLALKQLLDRLRPLSDKLAGEVICLAGNLPALAANRRFLWRDLNRLWTRDRILRSRGNDSFEPHEIELSEQRQLLRIIDSIVDQARGPLFFIDLHTTSSASIPFMAFNDQLCNRHFALRFGLPGVLGMEEFLVGPLLSHLNESGHVCIAFEAGQHTDWQTVALHESFAWLALVHAGVIAAEAVPAFDEHSQRLAASVLELQGMYEVVYRHPVNDGDSFRMKPGYANFKIVTPGETVATDCRGEVVIDRRSRIFMPLYQSAGEDGFFLVRKIPRWALALSTLLRRINFERVLLMLPGISRSDVQAQEIVVNRGVARFLATELLHLLGYRRTKVVGDLLVFSRREVHTNT